MEITSVIKTHFILYVKDQARSTAFYSQVLDCQPSLNVPGMTEFAFSEHVILGLMPISGIKRLLGDELPDLVGSLTGPCCEIYLLVNQPLNYHRRAVEAGAVELSGLEKRDWGHRAAYSLDPDGHVLAFAEELNLNQNEHLIKVSQIVLITFQDHTNTKTPTFPARGTRVSFPRFDLNNSR